MPPSPITTAHQPLQSEARPAMPMAVAPTGHSGTQREAEDTCLPWGPSPGSSPGSRWAQGRFHPLARPAQSTGLRPRCTGGTGLKGVSTYSPILTPRWSPRAPHTLAEAGQA